MITKDRDFVDSFVLRGEPAKLLLVSTGNISNRDLDLLFTQDIPEIEAALTTHQFVELGATQLTVHAQFASSFTSRSLMKRISLPALVLLTRPASARSWR